MYASPQIPAGWRQDAQGRLVAVSKIDPIDIARDELVLEIFSKTKALHDALKAFKGEVFGDIAAFVEMSAEQYGVQLGGKKGNVTLRSYCGRYKIERAMQDYIAFDERLQAAKALVDECLIDWLEGAQPEVATIIRDAFAVDKAGKIRVTAVLSLRRYKFDDPRWKKAMEIISDAVQVVATKAYIRVYERIGESDQFKPISLDLAGV